MHTAKQSLLSEDPAEDGGSDPIGKIISARYTKLKQATHESLGPMFSVVTLTFVL